MVHKREVEIGETTLVVYDQDDALTGACVWDCALVLSHWLEAITSKQHATHDDDPSTQRGTAAAAAAEEEEEKEEEEGSEKLKISEDHRVSSQLGLGCSGFKGKRVVELGAGTGLPGMVAAVLGAEEVVLTDRAGLLPGLRHNVDANSLGDMVSVEELEWGQDCLPLSSLPVDFVLMSDVVYDIDSLPALCKTLLDLSDEHTCILLAYELRLGAGECFKVLRESGFVWDWVPREEMHPDWQCEDIGIFILKLQN